MEKFAMNDKSVGVEGARKYEISKMYREGVKKNNTPSCIAAVLKNAPGDIFEISFCMESFILSWEIVSKLAERGGKQVKKSKAGDVSSRKRRPASTPEARENQMIALAVDLAEQQLMAGTASSQVITHFLKLGSTKERIEKEILEKQKGLIEAKTKSLQSAQRIEELYTNALDAMRNYSGYGGGDSESQNLH